MYAALFVEKKLPVLFIGNISKIKFIEVAIKNRSFKLFSLKNLKFFKI